MCFGFFARLSCAFRDFSDVLTCFGQTCAESIAFFGGGDRELQIVNSRFHKMLEQ